MEHVQTLRARKDERTMNGRKIELPKEDDRVFVTNVFAGFRAMQVCVREDVPDEEILEVCNNENPQLVEGGWHTVVRDEEHAGECGVDGTAAPGPCADCEGRMHKIVLCM